MHKDFEINNTISLEQHPRIQDQGFKGIKPKKNVAAEIRNIVNPQQSKEHKGDGIQISFVNESGESQRANMFMRTGQKREDN